MTTGDHYDDSYRQPDEQIDTTVHIARFAQWWVAHFRPHLGWAVLIILWLLSWLPAQVLDINGWLELRHAQSRLGWVGPLAVSTLWILWGWRRASTAPAENSHKLRDVIQWITYALLFTIIGIGIVSQLLLGWLPTWRDLWLAIQSGSWPILVQQMGMEFNQLIIRTIFWWQGVQGNSGTQDPLIFATLAGLIIWYSGLLTAWLTRRYRRGLLAALPILWLCGMLLIYGEPERLPIVTGLLLAMALHLLLDQQRLTEQWQTRQLDYNPGLMVDRSMALAILCAVIFAIALIMPNVSIDPLVNGYRRFMEPLHQQAEALGQRLFPDVDAVSRLPGGGGGGLPNDFLLGGGPDLGDREVMEVRTNDPVPDYYPEFYEEPPPPGYYMRGETFARYTGLGWENPTNTRRQRQDANSQWHDLPITGRRLLVQSIQLRLQTGLIYAAGEPLEVAMDYRAETRSDDDLAALWSSSWNTERSYTVVSAIPALGLGMLNEAAGWSMEDENLSKSLTNHLVLPETITERTRTLAQELTQNQPSAFARATAIEQFLRGYEYDLTISEPPDSVTDVADYFLFELQRGYCDYYATAFVVLARLSGLPARFATGYTAGQWMPEAGYWRITEAEAHSWPEVHFPEYGWIAFEPTAGRAELARVGETASIVSNPMPLPQLSASPESATIRWNWQMFFWLLPLAGLLWWASQRFLQWQASREEPWPMLLRWGQRLGRPLAIGETVLEYGHGLADHLLAQNGQERVRFISHEIRALSGEVNEQQYGLVDQRIALSDQIRVRWQRLRVYLRQI